MVKVKRMNENTFAAILREFNVAGELVRTRQEEKQGLLDEFDSESKRFFFGKISERALASSVNKTNKEILRLDADIRKFIDQAKRAGRRSTDLVVAQAPVRYRATISGLVSAVSKTKRRHAKKKRAAPKKITVRRKVVPKRKVAKRRPAKRKR